MSDTPFSPFDDILDRDTALSVLREAVAGADDGEVRSGMALIGCYRLG